MSLIICRELAALGAELVRRLRSDMILPENSAICVPCNKTTSAQVRREFIVASDGNVPAPGKGGVAAEYVI
jgi:hypothetical protein